MAMEALFSNEIFNLILYDTSPTLDIHSSTTTTNTSFPTSLNFLLENPHHHQNPNENFATCNKWSPPNVSTSSVVVAETTEVVLPVQGRKKRRRRSSKLCKNKEEAESQRMTHIAVERNRRKLMNEHLAVLRSLMPESYAERGDQASIVGGAITFVKELEHILQTLEAKKIVQSKELRMESCGSGVSSAAAAATELINPTPFSQFFTFPQYSFCSQMQSKYTRSKTNGGVADVEVTLTESHANIRALCQRRLRQLTKLLSGFHSVYLTILHLNVTTLDPLVLYSISAKVEERCQLKSADEIAAVVNQMLKMIAEDAI